MITRRVLGGVAALLTLLLLGSTLTSAGQPESDWPTWQKDLSGSRHNAAEWKLNPATVGKLKLKWAFAYPRKELDAPRSQPAVVDGTVFFGATDGKFHARDAKTGAKRWEFDLSSVDPHVTGRTPRNGPAVVDGLVYFGDTSGYLYALDQHTGKLRWYNRLEPDRLAFLTSSPIVFDGKVYVGVSSGEVGGDENTPCCEFRGHLDAVDARTGKLAWRYYTVPEAKRVGNWPSGAPRFEPSGVGVWSSPVVDAASRTVFVGTGQNYTGSAGDFDSMLALDTETGAVRWKQQVTKADTWRLLCADPTAPPGHCPGINDGTALDYDLGATANIFTAGGRKMVGIGQKSGVYHVFDAATGEVVWRRQLSKPQPNLGLTGIQWGSSYDGKALYIATWRANPGTLHALNPATGELLWKTPTPSNGCDWGGAAKYKDLCELSMTPAVSTSPGLVFEGSGDGKMRAFSARDGRVLWEHDTMRKVRGVNGLPGRGGSLAGGGGAVIADGMVYVQSGYWMPQYPNDRGHVLLAFGL